MRIEKATKKITQSGDSLVINVTKEVKRLGLDRGDTVDITLSSEQADNLAFLNRILNNAIRANDVDINRAEDGAYYADYPTVMRIVNAVADCCGGYDLTIKQSMGRYYVGVYEWDDMGVSATLLIEVVFIDPEHGAEGDDTPRADHD